MIRIVVVEDELVVQRDLVQTIKGLGYNVVGSSAGSNAIALIERLTPDLVLMDIHLEDGINGIDLADVIGKRWGIPVIYVTAYSDSLTVQKAHGTAPYGYVLKPFNERELFVAIEIALYRVKTERQLRSVEIWLTTTLRSIADAVIAADADGKVTLINPQAARLIGMDESSATGRHLGEVLHLSPPFAQVHDLLNQVRRDGVVLGIDSHLQLFSQGNGSYTVQFSMAPIRDDSDAITGFVIVVRDMTNLVRADMALKAAHEALQYAYDATLEGWVHALDIRDKETEGHTRRVTRLTLRMGRSLGITADELEQWRRGALLHDIGKLGIPDSILLKDGPLTQQEWKIMAQHPVYADEWLRPIAYLKDALDIPANHHEKWDGTGYPRGLLGDAIPLAARVFALADTYDAMTSDRPYRRAWTSEQAVREIRALAGTQFDPHLAALFCIGVESGVLRTGE